MLAAIVYEDYFFFQSEDYAAFKEYKPANKVILFRKFDERVLHYDKPLTSTIELANWIDYYSFKIVENITYKSVERILSSKKPMILLFHDSTEESKIARKELKIAGQALRGKIIVAESQIEEGMGKRFAEYMNVTQQDLPAVRIHWITDTEVRRYIYQGDITSQGLQEFYEKWRNDELSATYKSESVPQDNGSRLVKKVVGDNFDQIVRDQSKDVFLVITVPWCGELCPKIIDVFSELAGESDMQDVIFAEMDATLNEVEGLIIEQLPCIKFYPKDYKYGNIRYKEKYSVEAVLEFLKKYKGGEQINEAYEEL